MNRHQSFNLSVLENQQFCIFILMGHCVSDLSIMIIEQVHGKAHGRHKQERANGFVFFDHVIKECESITHGWLEPQVILSLLG